MKCINATFAQEWYYSDESCQGEPLYKLDMVLGCSGKVGATPPSYFGPTGSSGYSCQPGEFSAASSGRLVTTGLYQATTCSAPPSYFTTYAISTCVKDSSSRQSMLVTCGEAGATVERFSDERCADLHLPGHP